MRNVICLFLGAIILVSCKSLDAYNKHIDTEISPEKLKKDVDYVERKLFKLHPDVDWYISKEALRKKFDSLRATITSPMKPNDFFMKISPVVSEVRQGHISLYPLMYTYSKAQKKKYKGSENPLSGYEYIYKNNRLIISKNNRKDKRDKHIQIGTEVVSINGIKPKDLFQKYRKTYSSDGFNETFIEPLFARTANRYYITELKFVDSLQMELKCGDSVFVHTSHRIFKKENKKKNLPKTQKDSTETKKKEVVKTAKKDSVAKPKLTKEQRKKRRLENRIKRWKGSEEGIYAKDWSYAKNDSATAILKLTTFNRGNAKIYDTIFKEIKYKNVENLIIDLRGNTGGSLNDVHELSRYLNKEDYHFIDPVVVNHKTFAFSVFRGKYVLVKTTIGLPFLGTFAIVKTLQTKKEDGVWKCYLKTSKKTTPNLVAYDKKIYVLTDGLIFSAGAIIASHIRANKNAIFVGEETGGTFNGTVAGIMPEFELPHSKLKWKIGIMSVKPSNKTTPEGYGVKPDVEIIPTIEDIIEKEDTALEWIFNDIKTKKETTE